MIFHYRITSKIAILVVCSWLALGCMSSNPLEDEILHGSISYPFQGQSPAVGRDFRHEKFIIKSAVGDQEYTVEIPHAAKDYDIEVPLDHFSRTKNSAGYQPNRANPVITDRELTSDFATLQKNNPRDTAFLDRGLGLSPSGGPEQEPSYALGIAKINELYLKRQFEYALIEINNLIRYYPSSAKLFKMKGTVLAKMQNYTLAEKAWQTALTLAPHDQRLKQTLMMIRAKAAPYHGIPSSSSNQPAIVPQAAPATLPTKTYDRIESAPQSQAFPNPVGTQPTSSLPARQEGSEVFAPAAPTVQPPIQAVTQSPNMAPPTAALTPNQVQGNAVEILDDNFSDIEDVDFIEAGENVNASNQNLMNQNEAALDIEAIANSETPPSAGSNTPQATSNNAALDTGFWN